MRAQRRLLPAVLLFFAVALAGAQSEWPSLPSDRLGVYSWEGQVPGGSATARHSSGAGTDNLAPAVVDIERFDFRTVRIVVAGRYDYIHPARARRRFEEVKKPVTLVKILALPRYRKILEHSQFKTVWLTAYPVFDYGQGPDEIDLRRKVAEREWEEEHRQLREMVEWLYRNFGDRDKVILISNNEADEKLREVLNATGKPELAVGNVERDLQTRFQAVTDVREKFPSARLKVFSGVEISLWKLKLGRTATGEFVKQNLGLNALEEVLPQVNYDFVSFSAWETMASKDVHAALTEALADIRMRTRRSVTAAGRAFFGQYHVLLGEFRFAREWKLAKAVTAGLAAVLRLLDSEQVRYAVYWQLYDNTEGRVKQFGLVDGHRKVTCAGIVLMTYLRGQAALPAQETSCTGGIMRERMPR